MSLLRMAIRYCAVGALREQTWAQDRVYDSDQTPLAEAVLGTVAKPYVLVYTDQDDLNPMPGVAEIYSGDYRRLSVVLEIGVASAVRDPKGVITIQFAATDQGMEAACDVMEAQCLAALIGNPYSDWGDLFKRLYYKLYRVYRRRGGQAAKGVRFAARRVVIICSTNYELAPGAVPPPNHPLLDFITLANQKPLEGMINTAGIIQQLLAKTQMPDWRMAQAYLGLDTAATRLLVPSGTPLYEVDDEPSPLTELDEE